MSVFISDGPFRRIRGFWSQMAVLGGSGLGSGLLELLGLDFDFLGPPELGSGLLEHAGWILPPQGPTWGPSTHAYKRFTPPVVDLFSSTSHKHEPHHRMLCCRTSNINVSINTSITNICAIIQRYQLPTTTCQQQRSIMTNIKIDNATATEPRAPSQKHLSLIHI